MTEPCQSFSYAVFDVLCPMHAVVAPTGHIVHAGPTFAKLGIDADVLGLRLLELMEVVRPKIGPTMYDLQQAAGQRLHLRLRIPPRTELKGVVMPLAMPLVILCCSRLHSGF